MYSIFVFFFLIHQLKFRAFFFGEIVDNARKFFLKEKYIIHQKRGDIDLTSQEQTTETYNSQQKN